MNDTADWPSPFDEGLLRAGLGLEDALRVAPEGALVGGPGPDADVVIVLEGVVELHRHGRLVSSVEAPAVIGLSAWMAAQPWTLERRAGDPVRYASVERTRLDAAVAEDPALRSRLARRVAEDACTAHGRLDRAARVYDDLFRAAPGARLLPGPYRFGPFEAVIMVAEDEPSRVASVLPTGVRPMPGLGGRYVILTSFVDQARRLEGPSEERFGYLEVAVFVPATSDFGAPGLFGVELYPDATMPILLGREIYGFPKRLGRIERRRDGFDLYVGHKRGLRARLGSDRPVDAEGFGRHLFTSLLGPVGVSPLPRLLGRIFGFADRAVRRSGFEWPDARVLLEKRLSSEAPSCRPQPALHQLLEVPLSPFGFDDFSVFPAAVLTLDANVLPLGGELLTAVRCRFGFELGDARIQRNLSAPAEATGWWQRFAGGQR